MIISIIDHTNLDIYLYVFVEKKTVKSITKILPLRIFN